jgi:hypothetical protein
LQLTIPGIEETKDPILKKKIFDLDNNKVTLHNVLALARKYEKTERACAEKESISNIFVKKAAKKGGKATPSQPVQQLQSTQSSTNVNAKANSSGAKRPCNRCVEDSTYEQRQNCPAKADTCTNCKKKGHRAIICHNGKRLNATGQVASATAPDRQRLKSSKSSKAPKSSSSRGTSSSNNNKVKNVLRLLQNSIGGTSATPATRLQRSSSATT